MKFLRILQRIAGHFAVGMALGLIVLIILDEHNPMMYFLTSNAAKAYMCVMAACVLAAVIPGRLCPPPADAPAASAEEAKEE